MVGKLLIIEDDPTAMRLIEYALKQRGYQVMTTRNGLEGIITAQKEEPDLIILDIMLPGIDGFEVCKRLRTGTQTAKIPILVISAKIQKEDINTGFRAGADDYLCKPAAPSEIISRVENLLGKKALGQTRTIVFINSNGVPGMTMILVNLAAALMELGKRVTLVDVSRNQEGRGGVDTAALKAAPRVILETEPAPGTSEEPGYEVLPSGIRLLHVDAAAGAADDTGNANLIQKVGKNNDYVLIDLPLKPAPFTTSILKSSCLTVIVSDYRLVNIPAVLHTVTLLRFLGIKQEEIAAVLVNPEGELPGLTLNNVKPYIEANLGITLAEVISCDTRMSELFFLDNQPGIMANPNMKFSHDIKQIAKFIMANNYDRAEPPPVRKVMPSLEKSR